MRRHLAQAVASVVVGVPALVVVVVEVQRHGRPETFVSWPVVGVVVLAAVVAVLGLWTPPPETVPIGLVALLPAALLVYVVPTTAPLGVVALLLAVLAGWAIWTGGFASSLATFTALLLLLLTVTQHPAVECGARGSSTSSGPWWIETTGSAYASGSGGPDGDSSGVVTVGDGVYHYACRDGRVVDFGRRRGENLVRS